MADALQKEIQTALRAGDKLRTETLRMLLAAVKQKQIDSGADADVAAAARKLIKQRRDSAEQFRRAGREELAAREEQEINILAPFLPPAPDAAQLAAAVDAALAECGAASVRDLGRVMAAIKKALPGADLAEAGKLAKQKLSG